MRFLTLVALTLSLAGCDLLEPPPDVPPPDGAVHPFGEGNGKVVFLSDLAAAQRIDVTLGGEPIGAVTRFVGCPAQVTTDDSLATAVRPAGTYEYSARSPTGLTWASTTVTVTEDALIRFVLYGRPSQYAVHLPDAIEGFPVTSPGSLDVFHATVQNPTDFRLRVTAPPVVQGDRVDVVANGVFVVRGALLGTSDLWFDLPVAPGPNYVALRLSQDEGGDGAPVQAVLYDGAQDLTSLYSFSTRLTQARWIGNNVRNAC